MNGTGRPVEPSVPAVEDAAVGRHQPVTPTVRGGGHAHHRLVEAHIARRAMEGSTTEGEDTTVAGYHPISLSRGASGCRGGRAHRANDCRGDRARGANDRRHGGQENRTQYEIST